MLEEGKGHVFRDRVDLAGDPHNSSSNTHQKDPEVGAPKVQGQEVPTLCGTKTLSATTELVVLPHYIL